MTINDEIIVLANQIANKGKKPTVALIKAKLAKSVPLPTIISTLKVWQHDPNHIILTLAETNKDSKTNSSFSTETESLRELLDNELSQMKQEIIELKKLIHQLIMQQKVVQPKVVQQNPASKK
ncbi:MAG: hypothetical protein JJV99_03500 [Colwellia sp.]|nr:hypothetical protein [Colwellia sp.]